MIAALALMFEAAQLIAPGRQSVIDWRALPMLPYRQAPTLPPAVHDYVARETAIRACPVTRRADGQATVQADVAVLVGEDGAIRVIIPRAIDCPTVEQFAVGFVKSSARDNLRAQSLRSEGGWYRATLVFNWRE
ncbi:hypothetical protein [Sphingomonas japonica]|uniref:TonB C-terminal domain-containing protein n=1 Tax=Sphingomonas japonica TaxID=511662 RepID=A0ABX0U3B8_9SPHN|nr:hypothetical protein [Sphingomonas japonica]NIJ24984.1 hypothetical protein [Sphingomonas japonica]